MKKLLLAALLVAAPLGAQEQSVEVHGLMGAVTTATSDTNGLTPFLALQATVPTASSFYAPSLVVTPVLTGLPGTDAVSGPETFKAIELGLGVQQPIAKSLRLSLYGEFGASSKLGVKNETDRSARWLIGGIRTSGERGQLVVGVGADERLSGHFVPSLLIQGVLKTPLPRLPMDAALVGSIILNIGSSAYGYVGSDIFRVGIAVGI